jgi:hypothetical protein
MAARHVLYFTGADHYLLRAERAGLVLVAKFSGDEAGVAAFREHLRGARGALFAVVADLAGEDFHEEQVPYVRGTDREALLARRLAQRYRDTRLAAALSLGIAATAERRNERVLLASFTNTQLLAPWLDALEEAGARLVGVYSAPLLAPALAVALRARQERLLLVSANRAGLRQCYLERGRLRFARLEPTVDLAPQALAAFIRSETQRLLQYLVTLRALPRDASPVQVMVIAPPGARSVFEQTLHSDARLLFRTLDCNEALQALKIARVPEGVAAEALYVQLAARKPPREQFASRAERRHYLFWRLQRGIVAAGAAAFCACALIAGGRALEASGVRDQAAEELLRARGAAEEYARITSTFPVTETSTDNLKATVVEFRRIAERSAQPEPAFVHVSRVLQKYPQFELDSLRWHVAASGEQRDAALKGLSLDAQAEALVLIELSGRVNATQRSDYRGLTAQVQQFAAALASGGYQLARTQLPFDVTPEGVLSGDIGAGDSNEAPRFTVVLARKLP